MRKFAVFDIDGTLFRSGLYREVIYELLAAGQAPKSLREAFHDLEINWKARKSSDAFKAYESAMAVAFDAALPHVRITDFEQAAKTVVERMSEYVYVYTRDIIKRFKEEGYTLIAISGSQEEIVQPFVEKYGFDLWIGQHYERGPDGFFTGRIVKTHDGKDRILRRLVADNELTFEESIGVGDTKGDIGMLSIVQHPIAFNPESELFEHAKQAGWPITIERKNMIYNLEPHGNTFILV